MRLLFLGACSAAGAVLGLTGPKTWALGFTITALSLAACSLAMNGGAKKALMFPLLFFVLGLGVGMRESSRYRDREGREEEVAVTVSVEAERRGEGGFYQLIAVERVLRGELPRKGDLYLLRLGAGMEEGGGEEGQNCQQFPRWGEKVMVSGRLRIFSRVEGEVAGTLWAQEYRRLGVVSGIFRRGAAALRWSILEGGRDAGSEEALIRSMALGDYRLLGPGAQRDLRLSGLLHLCAASGFHVATLTALLAWTAARLGVGKRFSLLLALPGAYLFSLAAGSTPSVRRALTMACLSAVAYVVGRRPDPVSALGGAFVAGILISPRSVFSTGFQLSFSAAAGMVILFPVLKGRWCGRWPRALEPALVSVAAQMAVAPVMLFRFGELPIVAPLSNALAMPLAPLILLPTLIGGFAGILCPPLADLGFLLAEPFARLFLTIARVFASVGDRINAPLHLPPWGIFALCLLLLAFCVFRGRAGRWAGRGVVMVLLLALSGNIPVAWGPWGSEKPSVVFFDVGQGDSALLVGPGGERVLVDGGADIQLVKRKLKARGIRHLDAVLYSHGDRDHVGGLVEILGELNVGLLFRPSCAPDGGWEGKVLEMAAVKGVPVAELGGGERVVVGKLAFRVVGGPALLARSEALGEGAEGSTKNEGSLVLRMEMEGVAFLFTGDIEEVGQGSLLATGAQVRAEVLKVPHHGGYAANTDLFLEAVRPKVAVISVKSPNEYGHPAAKTLEKLSRMGCVVFRTDHSGDIVVKVREGKMIVREERPSLRN